MYDSRISIQKLEEDKNEGEKEEEDKDDGDEEEEKNNEEEEKYKVIIFKETKRWQKINR